MSELSNLGYLIIFDDFLLHMHVISRNLVKGTKSLISATYDSYLYLETYQILSWQSLYLIAYKC
jgi:hypothetical protein